MTSVASATSESGSNLSSPLFCRNFSAVTFLPHLFCRHFSAVASFCVGSVAALEASLTAICTAFSEKNQKFLEKDLEVKEKSVPLQPASEKGCLEFLRGRKKFLKNLKKNLQDTKKFVPLQSAPFKNGHCGKRKKIIDKTG